MQASRISARFRAILGSTAAGAFSVLINASPADAQATAPRQFAKTFQASSRAPTGAGALELGQSTAAIDHKLAGIVLPQIEFHSTTLADAVEFLRQESRRLDPDPNPQARGVNIFVKIPAASAGVRVTLTLTNIPLLEALKYLATQAGLKVRVEPYAVSLVPMTEDTESLVTAVFSVPPSLIGNVSSSQDAGPLDPGLASPLDQGPVPAK